MRLLHFIPVNIILFVEFMGFKSFVGAFPVLRAQSTVNFLVRRRQRIYTTLFITDHPPNTSIHLRSYCKHSRRHHARITNTCLSRGYNDGMDKTMEHVQKIYDNDTARKNRRERLHHHLNELGIDSDSLEDAALRSVTTTGKHSSFGVASMSWLTSSTT